MIQWTVSQQDSGLSLQAFLKIQLRDKFSAKAIKRSLDAGKCTLNGRTERFASHLVGRGDKVEFDVSEKASHFSLEKIADRVLYIDSDIFAIDKPPGISSESEDLLNAIQNEVGSAKLLHRLDKETSGVLLFARNKKAAIEIERQFKERLIKKTYLTLVDGVIKRTSGIIDNYLGKLKAYQGQVLWGPVSKDSGLRAVTHWQVLMAGRTATLLKVLPETGRTHQIRVHFSSLQHPILGDYQYGKKFECTFKPERLLLHASELSFVHPTADCSETRLVIQAPVPEDFAKAIKEVIS